MENGSNSRIQSQQQQKTVKKNDNMLMNEMKKNQYYERKKAVFDLKICCIPLRFLFHTC
jgi:hypothetical protein